MSKTTTNKKCGVCNKAKVFHTLREWSRHRDSIQKLGPVTIKGDTWVCIFGCYHIIGSIDCDCDCHNKYRIKLKHHELGPINIRGIKSPIPIHTTKRRKSIS